MGKSKTERIDRLEKMLQGSNGEMHTYEPYQGVFADLEEHHSRLKAVEHDVPGLAGEIDLLLRRVIKLEQATDPKVKLNVESFPFIASTADVEDVPGAGEVTSETHLWSLEERNVNVLQRMVKEAPSTEEWNTLTVDLAKAEARIKELEERARFWEVAVTRFRNGYTSFGSPERHALDEILS